MSEDTPGQPPSDETASTASLVPQSKPPERIGRYRILQKLGEGGMGEVYLAEQDDPRRKVALKIIKWGMDTKQVIARFEAERQALALMDHPNIAKVFDAGATDTARIPILVPNMSRAKPVHGLRRTRLTVSSSGTRTRSAMLALIQHGFLLIRRRRVSLPISRAHLARIP